MGLKADSKDVTIANLAVALTIQDARADDAEAEVMRLRARVADLEEQLAVKPKNGKVAVGEHEVSDLARGMGMESP